MSEFDQDGIQKIYDAVYKDGQKFIDRLKALQAFSTEYNNFSGIRKGEKGSVRFIMRTDSIGEDE